MKKRRNRHGVWKPKNSRFFYCRVRIGRRPYCRSTHQTDRKAAEDFAKRWRASIVRKLADEAANPVVAMTFRDAMDGFFKFKETKRSKRKQANGEPLKPLYRETDMAWLLSTVGGDTDLSKIDNEMIGHLVELRGDMYRWGRVECGKVKPATINQVVLRPMSGIMHWARKHRRVALPDMPHWGDFFEEGEARDREMSFREELTLLPETGAFRDQVEFILLTGLRLTSALLRWDEVLAEEKRIRVRVKGGKLHEIKITPEIQKLLDANRGKHGEFVFTRLKETTDGVRRVPITGNALAYAFRTAAQRCGIANIVIHDLRRTAGARMYRATGNIVAVSKFLGHANVAITVKHYVHITPDDVAVAQLAAELYRRNMLAEAMKYLQAA